MCACVWVQGLEHRATKRYNSGNRCNRTINSGKPQKVHSKTGSRPTSADQQHRTGAHEQGPKQLATARSTRCAPERRKESNTQHPTALSFVPSVALGYVVEWCIVSGQCRSEVRGSVPQHNTRPSETGSSAALCRLQPCTTDGSVFVPSRPVPWVSAGRKLALCVPGTTACPS